MSEKSTMIAAAFAQAAMTIAADEPLLIGFCPRAIQRGKTRLIKARRRQERNDRLPVKLSPEEGKHLELLTPLRNDLIHRFLWVSKQGAAASGAILIVSDNGSGNWCWAVPSGSGRSWSNEAGRRLVVC